MNATRTLEHGQEAGMRREFSALDRCDSCGARAWLRAVIGGTELLFCAHHGAEHFEALTKVADYIQDDREVVQSMEDNK